MTKPNMPLPPMDDNAPRVRPGVKNLRKSLFNDACRAPQIYVDGMILFNESERTLRKLGVKK